MSRNFGAFALNAMAIMSVSGCIYKQFNPLDLNLSSIEISCTKSGLATILASREFWTLPPYLGNDTFSGLCIRAVLVAPSLSGLFAGVLQNLK